MLMLTAAVGPWSSPDFAVSLDLEDGEGGVCGIDSMKGRVRPGFNRRGQERVIVKCQV